MSKKKEATLVVNNYDNYLTIRPMDQSNLIDHIPAMVYKTFIDHEKGVIVMMKDRKKFNVPEKRFGNHNKYFTAITKNYDKNGTDNGVLLSGNKGSGKSLLAEEVANWMLIQNYPVIMISSPMSAEEISTIIKVVGPCMVYIDEFGKLYCEDEMKNKMITLFSDTSMKGVLFLITGNNGREFSDYIFNRPQRFKFGITFKEGIEKETAMEVLQYYKVKEEFMPLLMQYSKAYDINMDSFTTVAKCSKNCDTLEELADLCKLLNVPELPEYGWSIKSFKCLDNDAVIENCNKVSLSLSEEKIRIVEVTESGPDRRFNRPIPFTTDLSDKETNHFFTIKGSVEYEVEIEWETRFGSPSLERKVNDKGKLHLNDENDGAGQTITLPELKGMIFGNKRSSSNANVAEGGKW